MEKHKYLLKRIVIFLSCFGIAPELIGDIGFQTSNAESAPNQFYEGTLTPRADVGGEYSLTDLRRAESARREDMSQQIGLIDVSEAGNINSEQRARLIRLLEANPDDTGLLIKAVQMFSREKRYIRAAEYCRRLTDIQPGKAEYWAVLGGLRLRIGRLEMAEEALEKASELVPYMLKAKYHILTLKLSRGELENFTTGIQPPLDIASINILLKWIQTDLDFLGEFLGRDGIIKLLAAFFGDESIPVFKGRQGQPLRMDEMESNLKLLSGNIENVRHSFGNQNFAEVHRLLGEIVDMGFMVPGVQKELAFSEYMRSEKKDAAMRKIARLHKRYPDWPSLTALYSAVLYEQDSMGRALDILSNMFEENPSQIAVAHFYCLGLLDTERFEKAKSAIEKVLSHYPENPKFKLMQACAKYHNGEIDEARSILTRLKQSAPETVEGMRSRDFGFAEWIAIDSGM